MGYHTEEGGKRRMKTKKKKTPQEKPVESTIRVDFVQAAGTAIPLCWIPAPDVKALIKFLTTHAPLIDQDRVVRAQYYAVADVLGQYVREAEARNDKSETRGFTYPDKDK